jgi:23S rRNA (adenine-N6)-dimethyltransferase
MQREAAERILGPTLFGLLIQPWFVASIMHRFKATDFMPRPRVEVVLLRLRKRGPPLLTPRAARTYVGLLEASFGAPTIEHALRPLIGRKRFRRLARDLNLDPRSVPSAVPLRAWLALAQDSNVTTMR